jgi:hypothetical protein
MEQERAKEEKEEEEEKEHCILCCITLHHVVRMNVFMYVCMSACCYQSTKEGSACSTRQSPISVALIMHYIVYYMLYIVY